MILRPDWLYVAFATPGVCSFHRQAWCGVESTKSFANHKSVSKTALIYEKGSLSADGSLPIWFMAVSAYIRNLVVFPFSLFVYTRFAGTHSTHATNAPYILIP